MPFNKPRTKFGRNYRAIIEDRSHRQVVIEPPITMEFTVERSRSSSSNVTHMRLYNLSRDHREALQKNRWNEQFNRRFELYVGYDSLGKVLPRVGFGNLNRVFSVREGSDVITTVESYDGGWASQQARSNLNIPSGTRVATIVDLLVDDLVKFGIKRGVISPMEGVTDKASTYSGYTDDLLYTVTGGASFIDNGFVHVLDDKSGIRSSIVINERTGLLDTPIRETAYIYYTMIFEPTIKLGNIIDIQSRTGIRVNGEHQVIEISHSGIVSPVVSGRMTTRIGVLNRSGLRPLFPRRRTRDNAIF